MYGGEGGIRTLGSVNYTRLAGEHHRPLGHFSKTSKSRYLPLSIMAEEVGFEPTEPLDSAVFKTAAFDHSATPPIDQKSHNTRLGIGSQFSQSDPR